jgi:hypothetical protein
MTTKTRTCDQCAWWTRQIDRCAKGHSPRFYKPRADQQHIQGGGDWGWRRRCDDYEAKA